MVAGRLWRDGGRVLARLRGVVAVAAVQLLSRAPIATRTGTLPTLSSRHSRAEERADSSPVAALGIGGWRAFADDRSPTSWTGEKPKGFAVWVAFVVLEVSGVAGMMSVMGSSRSTIYRLSVFSATAPIALCMGGDGFGASRV